MVGVPRPAHLLPLLESTYLICSLDTPGLCALAVSQADVERVSAARSWAIPKDLQQIHSSEELGATGDRIMSSEERE